MNLGYNQAVAHQAIRKSLEKTEDADLGALISTALRYV